MRPKEQEKLVFNNKCKCVVDYNLLEKAMIWYAKNTILISEFNMPKDRFRCVWEKKIKTQIGLENKHDKVERIFVPI